MGMAFKIGSLFGIPIRLHITMAIVPFFAFSSVESGDPVGFAIALVLTVLLFGSVVAHELGHALTARRFGVRTEDIVLLPIGGVARIVNLPKRPAHEIAIAAAGPAVSIGIAALVGFLLIIPSHFMPPLVAAAAGAFVEMNFILGVFNLVPALPMDGGRVLRGVLALKRDYLSATRIAVRIGRAIAIAGFVYAVWAGDVMLGFIAAFVFFGAGAEERIAWMRETAHHGGVAGPGGPFAPPLTDRDVIVIQGGKAEVISRKDRDERS